MPRPADKINAPPSVSVVMPVRNGANTLATAVHSILDQSLPSFELIVVDDGSTDNTAAVATQLADLDSRVRFFPLPPRGIVSALNTGVNTARAPLIARMDADDVALPRRLQRQLAFLDRHPDIGVVGCRVEFGGERGTQAGYAAYVDWTNELLTPKEIAANRFVESPFAHPSVVFRKALINRHGGYRDGNFPEDYELWLRWLERGVRMGKTPENLLVWNDPPDRLSRTHPRYARDAFFRCKAAYLARWLANNNPFHPDVILWGAGRTTRKRAEHLVDCGVRISAYVDIDPRSVGQTVHGRTVLGPDEVPGGRRGIRRLLRSQPGGARGYPEALDRDRTP